MKKIFAPGMPIPSTLLYPLCVNFMPQVKGRVAAIIQGGSFIFSATGLQIAGYFYQGSFRNIGIILTAFIFIAVIMLFFVIRNSELMRPTCNSLASASE